MRFSWNKAHPTAHLYLWHCSFFLVLMFWPHHSLCFETWAPKRQWLSWILPPQAFQTPSETLARTLTQRSGVLATDTSSSLITTNNEKVYSSAYFRSFTFVSSPFLICLDLPTLQCYISQGKSKYLGSFKKPTKSTQSFGGLGTGH